MCISVVVCHKQPHSKHRPYCIARNWTEPNHIQYDCIISLWLSCSEAKIGGLASYTAHFERCASSSRNTQSPTLLFYSFSRCLQVVIVSKRNQLQYPNNTDQKIKIERVNSELKIRITSIWENSVEYSWWFFTDLFSFSGDFHLIAPILNRFRTACSKQQQRRNQNARPIHHSWVCSKRQIQYIKKAKIIIIISKQRKRNYI